MFDELIANYRTRRNIGKAMVETSIPARVAVLDGDAEPSYTVAWIINATELDKLASTCVFTLEGEVEIETEPEVRFTDYLRTPRYQGRSIDLHYQRFHWGYYDFSNYSNFQFELKLWAYKKLALKYYPEYSNDANMLRMSITSDSVLYQISALGVTSAAEDSVSIEDMLLKML